MVDQRKRNSVVRLFGSCVPLREAIRDTHPPCCGRPCLFRVEVWRYPRKPNRECCGSSAVLPFARRAYHLLQTDVRKSLVGPLREQEEWSERTRTGNSD